jgi:hypothetical protein
MNIDESLSIYLLLIANAALLSAAAIAIVRFQKQCERLERFWNSPTGAALADQKSDQDRMQLLSTMRLERRLAQLQGKVDSLATTPAKSAPPPVTRQLPIENAIRMAKGGASVDELTRSCGLNIGEARLLRKMHGAAA